MSAVLVFLVSLGFWAGVGALVANLLGVRVVVGVACGTVISLALWIREIVAKLDGLEHAVRQLAASLDELQQENRALMDRVDDVEAEAVDKGV